MPRLFKRNTITMPEIVELIDEKSDPNLVHMIIYWELGFEELVDKIESKIPQTLKWVDKCYHRPSNQEIAFNAIEEISGSFFGVEYLSAGDAGFEYAYCNSGDTYNSTFILNLDTNEIHVGDWGTIVEDWDAERAESGEED